MKLSKKAKSPGRVKASILSWLGIPVTLTDPQFWREIVAADSKSGQTVTDESMLKLSAVWACARLISQTIATLPLSLYRRTRTGRELADGHQLHGILHARPNSDTTAAVFWESMLSAMLLRGNTFAERLIVGPRLVGLNFLFPPCLRLDRQANGTFRYWYTENGRQREIPADRIFRIPGYSVDGSWGISVVRYGTEVFGSAQAAQEAANSTFNKGLLPSVAFTIDRVLKPDQRTEFRELLKTITGALNAGESPLLEAGMKAEGIGIDPRDAQLLESRAFSVEEICRWFGVPPWMIGHGEKTTSWGTGIEQQTLGFLKFTLRSWLKRVEQFINAKLLTPAEQATYFAEFNIEGLLRGDSKARAEFYSSALNNGWMNRNQVCRSENLPPIGPAGDIYTVQSALVDLGRLGIDPPQDEQARNALARWLGLDEREREETP